jgi:hypothetical protein
LTPAEPAAISPLLNDLEEIRRASHPALVAGTVADANPVAVSSR